MRIVLFAAAAALLTAGPALAQGASSGGSMNTTTGQTGLDRNGNRVVAPPVPGGVSQVPGGQSGSSGNAAGATTGRTGLTQDGRRVDPSATGGISSVPGGQSGGSSGNAAGASTSQTGQPIQRANPPARRP